MATPVTEVSAVPPSGTTQAPSSAPKGLLSNDDFLRLLVTQLRNQNPLNPLSNDQFISQSAQFSSLGALEDIKASIKTMASNSGATALSSATPLLNEPVSATAASFNYTGAAVTLPYTLTQPVSGASIQVSDSTGKVVASVPLGNVGAGANTATFAPSQALPAGTYKYQIVSMDATGRATAVPAIIGVVNGISLGTNGPLLNVNGQTVSLSDVVTVGVSQ